MKLAGTMFILLGFGLTVLTTVSIFAKQKVFDGGGIEITRSSWYSYSWSPLLGIALIIIGAVLLITAPKTTQLVYTEKEVS